MLTKANPTALATIAALLFAIPATIGIARTADASPAVAADPTVIIQPDAAARPAAGLVTIVDARQAQFRPQRRIAWRSLAAVPIAERQRLRALIDALPPVRPKLVRDRHQSDRVPLHPPRCMVEVL